MKVEIMEMDRIHSFLGWASCIYCNKRLGNIPLPKNLMKCPHCGYLLKSQRIKKK